MYRTLANSFCLIMLYKIDIDIKNSQQQSALIKNIYIFVLYTLIKVLVKLYVNM